MIKLFKKKIRRNYYKAFDRNAETIDVLTEGFNLMSDKLDEVITKTNGLEKEVETLKKSGKGSER